MELAGKEIAILGGTRLDCEIVHAAKGLGMRTTVISYDRWEDSPAKRIADAHAEIDLADTDSAARYIIENGIDGAIVGFSDTLLPWYAEICEKADIPCYGNRELFDLFTDKGAWKEECRKFAIPTAEPFDYPIRDPGGIPFPVFVKPKRGSGARGTSVAYDEKELGSALRRARAIDPSDDVLIEKYLEGFEITVFWLFIDGKRYVSQIGNRHVKSNQDGAIPLPAGYSFPSSEIPRYLERIAPSVDDMLEAHNVQNGMMFMQCICNQEDIFVYDIGFRLTGSLEYHLTKEIAGYSAMEMLLHFAVTGRMTDDSDASKKIERGLESPAFNISVLMKPGILGRFEGLDTVREDESYIASMESYEEGDILPWEARGELRQIALRILGVVDDVRDIEEKMLQIQGEVRVLSPDGNDLTLPGIEPSDVSLRILDA